jgi:hypothetical protein
VQSVDGLGTGGHQILASLGQQVQDRCLVLDGDLPQSRAAPGGDGHGDRVVGVALAAMANRQYPHPGGQLGRHLQDLFAVADQPLGQRPADAMGTFDRPAALRPLRVLSIVQLDLDAQGQAACHERARLSGLPRCRADNHGHNISLTT